MRGLILLLTLFSYLHAKSLKEKIPDNSHWEKQASFLVDNSEIDVSKYKSSLTGKKIIIFCQAQKQLQI